MHRNFSYSLLLLLAISALPMAAQEDPAADCPRGPAALKPLPASVSYARSFQAAAAAIPWTLRRLGYRVDTATVRQTTSDSGTVRTGYWTTRVAHVWPQDLDRVPWQGHAHPGLWISVVLTGTRDSSHAVFTTHLVCASDVPELDASNGPALQLQIRTGAMIAYQVDQEMRRR
jgi:hypothetical protein